MPRKTIEIDRIRELVNRRLAIPDAQMYLKDPDIMKDREMTPAQAYRMALASLLETIEMQTGTYAGYGYQPGQVTRYATEPGDSPDITDQTRRIYYAHRSLLRQP